LKLLYKAATRCSKRLFFAETSAANAESAFCKWETFAKNYLTVKLAVLDIKKITQTAEKGINDFNLVRKPEQHRSTLDFRQKVSSYY
jgi:hypothetical protein